MRQSSKKNRSFEVVLPFSPESITTKMAKTYLACAIDTGAIPEKFISDVRVTADLFFEKRQARMDFHYFEDLRMALTAIESLCMLNDGCTAHIGGINFYKDPDRPRVIIRIEELSPFAIDDELGIKIERYAAQRS